MAPLPVGQGSKEPARGGVLGVSSATSFFLEFPLKLGLDSGLERLLPWTPIFVKFSIFSYQIRKNSRLTGPPEVSL